MKIKFAKYSRGEGGFTALELAMVMIVAAFLMLPVYSMITSLMRLGPDEERMDNIRYGLAEHLRVFGTLPCPADITAAPGDPTYASSQNCTAGVLGNADVMIGSLPVNDLAGVMDCLGGQDYDPNFNYNAPGNAPQAGSRAEYIHNLPSDLRSVLQKNVRRSGDIHRAFRELQESGPDPQANPVAYREALNDILYLKNTGIPQAGCVRQDMMFDQYGNKFVYAVTADATNLDTFDQTDATIGRVIIRDANNNPMTENPVWFAILSMGPDGKGAYDRFGNLSTVPCGAANAALDNLNCDLTNGIFRAAHYADTNDANHFDDFIDFSLDRELSEHENWYWAKNETDDDVRNLVFPAQRRLVIDALPATITDPDTMLFIGDGNMNVLSGDFHAANNLIAAEGSISADEDIDVSEYVETPAYCYSDRTGAPDSSGGNACN